MEEKDWPPPGLSVEISTSYTFATAPAALNEE
jgi:hypothetical protein